MFIDLFVDLQSTNLLGRLSGLKSMIWTRLAINGFFGVHTIWCYLVHTNFGVNFVKIHHIRTVFGCWHCETFPWWIIQGASLKWFQQSVGCLQALEETIVWAIVTHTISSFFSFSVVSFTFYRQVITTCYSFLPQSVNLPVRNIKTD